MEKFYQNRDSGPGHDEGSNSIDLRIARRLAALRAERGWSLDALAKRTEISRASLSRVERGELSPTATMLATLCAQYGWSMSRLMAEAEQGPPSVVRATEQITWKDPATGYVRRIVSPPHPQLRAEMVEIVSPAERRSLMTRRLFRGWSITSGCSTASSISKSKEQHCGSRKVIARVTRSLAARATSAAANVRCVT